VPQERARRVRQGHRQRLSVRTPVVHMRTGGGAGAQRRRPLCLVRTLIEVLASAPRATPHGSDKSFKQQPTRASSANVPSHLPASPGRCAQRP
jgi:hypothetical protein